MVSSMEIVDRQREIEELRRLAAEAPALVVLRGRRRVGKTFLLRVALPGERVVSLQAEEKPLPLQLEAYARECSRLLPGEPPLVFGDWGEAFDFVERQARTGGALVVILDEFQYLVASDPGLESTIQRFWDRWDSDGVPVLLILSGSALSFMDQLLSGARPTYGRSAFRPLLLPLTYRDCSAFAQAKSSPANLIERFAVFGGTPQYQRWAGQRPLFDAIERTCLLPDAPLHSDPEHLIREEAGIREPGPYFGTLQAIAEGYTGTSAIAGRLQIKQQLATKFLSRLLELGYVARVEPLEPGGRAAGRGYWKIADPYFRFWFRYVFPNRSRLARGRTKELLTEIRRDLSTFVGRIFEDCCREWVGRYSSLGDGALEIGSWWSRQSDVEVDIVTLTKKGYGLLGSCKWSTRQVGENVLDDLYVVRGILGRPAATARLVLFSRSSFTRAVRARAADENVTLVDVADLF
jgi:AAA+ ATPase superfamily predicted ATPase